MTHYLLLQIMMTVQITATVELFTKLGFVVHTDNSVFEPTQDIEVLGFIINSLTMSVTLSTAKAAKVQNACHIWFMWFMLLANWYSVSL